MHVAYGTDLHIFDTLRILLVLGHTLLSLTTCTCWKYYIHDTCCIYVSNIAYTADTLHDAALQVLHMFHIFHILHVSHILHILLHIVHILHGTAHTACITYIAHAARMTCTAYGQKRMGSCITKMDEAWCLSRTALAVIR